GLTGPRPFESAISAEDVQATVLGPGEFPAPRRITLDQHLLPDDNYRWVDLEGKITFAGTGGDFAILELSDGRLQVQVHALSWDPAWSTRINHSLVRIEGVCEAVRDEKGQLVPGLLWAATE